MGSGVDGINKFFNAYKVFKSERGYRHIRYD